MKRFFAPLMAASALALTACGSPDTTTTGDTGMTDPTMGDPMMGDPATSGTVVDVVASRSDLSNLGDAVRDSGMAETLNGAGPYTVFAPTNNAFSAVPAGAVDRNDRQAMSNVLSYHVVEGEVRSDQLMGEINAAGENGYRLNTVGGGTLTARLVDGNVVLTDGAGNTATVTTTDVDASNGVIHVIDGVLMPA